MKSLNEFYDFYLHDVPGCTYFTAGNELRRAAQEFCAKTKALIVQLQPLTTFDSVRVYEFDVTKQLILVQLESASLDGAPLQILLRDQNARQGSITMLNDREFQINPPPNTGQRIEMRAVVKPSNTAQMLPDELFDQYAEAIAHGAKARLFMQPDKPYTNMPLAKYHEGRFFEEISRTQVRVATGFSNAPLRTLSSFL